MTSAFVFPGQGSQSIGMLSALAAEGPWVADAFEQASQVLGFDLWALCQHGPEADLNRTENTQPAVLAADIATWRAWLDLGGETPSWLAGHSLGEYAALVAAQSLDFSDAIGLVALRGSLMQKATPEGTGAMAAILGLENQQLEQICADIDGDEVVACANYNAPGQVVIAGHKGAVDKACDAARDAGARRALPLAVSVPSHCALMQPAAGQLEQALNEVEIQSPMISVLHNADVKSHQHPDDIRKALARQLWQPVRWTDTITSLRASGVDIFIECGPGKVLTGLNRRICKQATTGSLNDRASIQQLIDANEH